MAITILLFILSIFFIFYLPGRLILRISKFSFNNFPIMTSSALTSSICLFLLTTYLFAWLRIPVFGILIMGLLAILELIHLFSEKRKIYSFYKKLLSVEIVIILIGSFIMAYLMWFSGMLTNDGLVFYSINATDAIFHLSLVGNLINHFPPTHSGLDGISLRGYHFFYDFLLADFSNIFKFSPLDLYFRLFPFFIAFFYGISGWALASFLNLNKLSTRIFLFLLYFGQGFGFLVSAIFHGEYNTGIIQSSAHILDPNVLFSVAILFTIFIFLFSSKTILQIVLTAILIGVLPNIKIYTAVIVFGAVFIVSIVDFFRTRETKFIKISLLSSIIACVVYLPINYGAGKLIFAPFLLYKHFMESTLLFSSFQWALKYQVFAFHDNYFRLTILYIIAFFLFFVPSLGLRLVNIIYLPKLLQKKFYSLSNVFWITGISISFLIPTFFIQDVAVFVIIQFLWLGYILLLLPTSITLGRLLNKTHIIFVLLFFGILVLLSIPELNIAIKTFTQNQTLVSNDTVAITKFIKQNIPQDKKIIVLNRDKKENEYFDLYNIPIISALSEHSIFYEPEVLSFKTLDKQIQNRKNIIDKILEITYTCDATAEINDKVGKIMLDTGNQYLLIFKNNSCFSELKNLKQIHEEGNLVIYKLL